MLYKLLITCGPASPRLFLRFFSLLTVRLKNRSFSGDHNLNSHATDRKAVALVATILREQGGGGEVEVVRVRSAIAHRGPKVAIIAPSAQRAAITPIVVARAIEIQRILQ